MERVLRNDVRVERPRGVKANQDSRCTHPELDLTYLASGYWQHVFTKTGEPGDIWVYKLPAAFGYIVPIKPTDHLLSPRNRFEKALSFVLAIVPEGVWNQVQRLSRRMERRGPSFLKGVSTFAEHLAELLLRIGSRVLAAYCRPMRRRKFLAMLKLMEYLTGRGLYDIFLSFRIIREGEATLRVHSAAIPYRGPILVQRKADSVFEKGESYRCFDWRELVDAQHRLWRLGVGFSVGREVLGPWSLLDGHARLFDTSGLTDDYRRARESISEESLAKRERAVLGELKERGAAAVAEEYFRFIRKEINQERLDQLWKADLGEKV